MPEDQLDGSPFEEIVVDCLARMERDGAAGLEACCRDYPQASQALRRRVAALQQAGMLDSPAPAAIPSVVGDFQLKELLGRGGMGVVYRAEQTSLGRPVALKLIRNDGSFSSGRLRERFQREITAVTRLSHPGIVQVYAAQADAEVPYLAMEFVDGAPLSDLLDKLRHVSPQDCSGSMLRDALGEALQRDSHEWNSSFFDRPWERVVLDVVSQITAAVRHAHERGVWHRDLKPSNVILTPTGHTKILDFGLASLRGATRMTMTGSPLGSLPYMAPEVIEEGTENLTAAADVYSLGVILYELLTLRLPHWDESAERLAHRIVKGVAPPPEAWNHSIAAGTSVICQRALERVPAHRFADPQELWEDLEAQRAGAPIRSRPPGLGRRIRRLLGRSPVGVASAVIAVVIGLAVVLVLKTQDKLDIQEATGREVRSTAHESVRRILSMSRHSLTYMPGQGQQVNTESIATALNLWRPYYEETPGDPPTRLTWARLTLAQAKAFLRIGRTSEAEQGFREALRIFESEAAAPNQGLALQQDLGSTLHGLSYAVAESGDHAQERRILTKCVEVLDGLWRQQPHEPRAVHDALTARHSLANAMSSTGDSRGALKLVRQSMELAEETLERWPDLARSTEVAARLAMELGQLTTELGDPMGAMDHLTPWLQRLADSKETYGSAALRILHPVLGHRLSMAHKAAGDRRRERELLDECIELQRSLVQDYPSWSDSRSNLAIMLQQRSVLAFEGENPDVGWQDSDESVELIRALVDQEPETVRHRENLATGLSNQAMTLLSRDPADAADRAEQILDEFVTPPPTSEALLDAGTTAAAVMARGLAMTGELEASVRCLDQWTEPLRKGSAWNTRFFADAWNEWLLAVARSETVDGEQLRSWQERGEERMFELLNQAIDLGYSDIAEITSTESLMPYQERPQMQAILRRLRRG